MDNHVAAAISQAATSEYGSDVSLTALSDYGSDIDLTDIQEDTALSNLLNKLAASAPNEIYPSIEKDAQDVGLVPQPWRQPLAVHLEGRAIQSSPVVASGLSMEFEYDAPSRRAFSVPKETQPSQIRPTTEPNPFAGDSRTPLERFRTKPKKPLSVTDLVSPAWCELQYSYTLSKFGRKPRTQAMKTGSKIHQALEDEVHTTIPVETVSKEDRFGLKLWNTIQGLRCLRETGLTRELEIWGTVEGQVVNGVIDELSFTCPDPEMEGKLEFSRAQQSGGTLPLGQLSIEQAFGKAGGIRPDLPDTSASAWLGIMERDRHVYIADVKTRGGRLLPKGASLRPTWMQLMLYRKLLESLLFNTVDAETIFARYGLAPLESFSEAFIVGGGAFGDAYSDFDPENPYSILQANELISHPNLSSLWSLMISEYQQTIPTLSDILRAEFRYAKTGEVIGNELTTYSADTIDAYVKREMEWWKGDREAKGVEIEEAFKCRMCDFAEECTWRKTKIEEATEKSRLRKGARGKSAV
ncbi:uncharacterized protein N0V89_010958 [Didymosphaeria variabile]|uniref:Exonuclease V n=1 Tax=Didymosphaeria variabile TaxID=1932322 RepID=A0A9W8XDV4_9PLEO|nr:uncharacterized protein N0V89_010958 [Didymosphaeria variabile]KAJ4347024.1 hypothetical protein N0V89_010958 [Didymosphaeria variabile]